jgi:hypothetical protein
VSNTVLADRIRAMLAGKRTTEQVMFGGICFMLNGNMALGASPRGLLVRVGKAGHAAALKRAGTRPMVMRSKTMEGYIHVDEAGTARDRDLERWIDIAMAHAASLPAKTKPEAKAAAGAKSAAKAKPKRAAARR